jgi:hypothetical protein
MDQNLRVYHRFMATPARRPGASVSTTTSSGAPGAPVQVAAPFGWALVVMAGIGLLLSSWALYPNDDNGMWAGYRGSLIGTVVLMAAMALRSTLPKRPVLGLIGLCGVLLVLFAVFLAEGTEVFVTELVAGIALLLGTALQAGSARD